MPIKKRAFGLFFVNHNTAFRLTRENNKPLDKTLVYAYDERGNITSKTTYAYTTGTVGTALDTKTYTYNTTHKDRLASFGGSSVAYNRQGCPTTYLGKTLTWTNGRLTSFSQGDLDTGIESCDYTYNAKGQMIKAQYSFLAGLQPLVSYETARVVNYKYALDGRLVNENIVRTYNSGGSDSIDFVYLYDNTGICGCVMKKNSTTYKYYFVKNTKGDVVAIYNESGLKVVEYAYDAYGNCTQLATTDYNIAANNHIKYRGYCYEENIGLYWLQTRFYDANTGRFISPDATSYLDTDQLHGVNLYVYCNDDPINYVDPSGHLALLAAILIGTAVGVAVGFGATLLADYKDDGVIFNGSISTGAYIGNTLIGGAIGALIGSLALGLPSLLTPTTPMALSYAGAGVVGVATIGVSTDVLTALGLLGALVLFSKHRPGMTGRQPFSWLNREEGIEAMRKFNGDANKATDYIMNNHWGDDWHRGAGTYWNVIKKWLDRIIRNLL